MDGNILVTPEELTRNASEFSASGNSMYQIANEMLQTVQGLSGIWGGDATNTYINNFKRSFDRLKGNIDAHASALTELASMYQQAEQKNVETANDFRDVLE